MKTIYKKLLFLFLLLPLSVLAQSNLSGVVVDEKSNQPLPGVNVTVQGANQSTSTDFDGKFQLNKLKSGDKILFSFIGYESKTVNYSGQKEISVSLGESANQLQEVVVQVGYGTARKKDVTGAVTTVTSKDFNKGAVLSADQLLIGKAAGVRITSDGGQPDTAPNIRIRGIGSFNTQQSPLIVIDNVPIDNTLAAGQSNPLSMINPNDIESFTILKDASASAIYGSRASNGVIIITTKKGSTGKPQFTYSSTFSFGKVDKLIDVMDGPTYTKFINDTFGVSNPEYVAKLGIPDPNSTTGGRILYNTNWQNEIYRATTTQDHNFTAKAAIFGDVPFRASIGYNKTEGLVRTNDYSRITAGLKLTPTFLDGHLKVDVNAKGISSKKNAIDVGGIISAALNMDPTKPVYGDSPDNRFAGYYQEYALINNRYQVQGQTNPVAALNQRYRPESVDKFLGNIEFDYKTHFLPDLHVVVNAGMETSQSSIKEMYTDNAINTYRLDQTATAIDPATNYVFNPGLNYAERQTVMNKTLDAYLLYSKKLTGAISRFEAQAGHSFQSFVNDGNKSIFQYNTVTGLREPQVNVQNPNNRYYGKMTLESYFGRANIDFFDKYLLTMTIRADASSLFQSDKRWGYFPAFGLAWKMKEESFLKNSTTFEDLKLRVGYGLTGNSDIRDAVVGNNGNYPYTPIFIPGSPNGQYLPGVNIYSAAAFNPNLTWEKATTINTAIDFSLFKGGKVSGTIDAYVRKSTDLLAIVNIAPGQFLTNAFVTNAGAITNKGIETSLNVKIINSDIMNWSVNGNLTYNIGKVDDVNGATQMPVNGGNLPGIGRTLIYNAVGEEPRSAWVFEQVYDSAGKPIPNVFVDRNGDGTVDDKDKYFSATIPHWTYGFSTTFNYKNFDFNASFRGQIGGRVYNSVLAQYGTIDRAKPLVTSNLNNVLNDLPFQNTNGNISTSDFYLENATFLRCESVSLGYKFDKLYKGSSLRLYVGANNLFILTKYSGQDPENFNGIDSNFYPRPRVFNIGVNIDF
ncbi:SusC/RagA family TonB-linked outer membrane protein [Flavobacterium sp. N1994]|uniref:SusC/RagA family TonB-linked outer membrane protein n=1 Tax=Flavobacterium sp. N1994 TaxID=2986827 RepID=UPI002223225D|nr:SusC/RagA family TonB-linked outer membrane protein [Flavobacterium sp. N1994]